ncbi:hypothetical protein QBC35DRAFT_420749, partial [Podospora australis]
PVRLPSTPTPLKRPKARPRGIGVQIIATLYTIALVRADRHLCRQVKSKKASHCRAPRILFINPGGICGSFREHKRGRIL